MTHADLNQVEETQTQTGLIRPGTKRKTVPDQPKKQDKLNQTNPKSTNNSPKPGKKKKNQDDTDPYVANQCLIIQILLHKFRISRVFILNFYARFLQILLKQEMQSPDKTMLLSKQTTMNGLRCEDR